MIVEAPIIIAIGIAFFLVFGSVLTLLGAIGMLRFGSFYQRLHMPTLATSWGCASVVVATIVYGCLIKHHQVFYMILLSVFVAITTPVTLMLLSRAAMHRDIIKKSFPFLRSTKRFYKGW